MSSMARYCTRVETSFRIAADYDTIIRYSGQGMELQWQSACDVVWRFAKLHCYVTDSKDSKDSKFQDH